MIKFNIKRIDGETVDNYKYRICDNKKLLGATWEGIAEIINEELGLKHGESAYRKWFKAYSLGRESIVVENASTEELDKLTEKTKEFDIAKVQYQDQTREYKKYLRHEARLDNLLKKLIESIKDEVNKARPLVQKRAEDVSFNGKTALTLLLSDLHKGMVTDNHWNTFNDDVFYQRIQQTIDETVNYQKITGARELHIMQLGDLIEGNLHRLTKIGETETAVEQTKSVAEALSNMVSILANHFEKITVHSVKGNHDRVSSRKEEEIKTESFHDFVTWYMEARLEGYSNVTFNQNEYDSEIIVADILGKTYFGVHGHLERGYGNVIQNLTMMIQKFPTAVFAGHIHKNFENEVHSVDLVVNGGFAGTNNYAKDSRLLSKAHQKLLWLDESGRRATFYIKF